MSVKAKKRSVPVPRELAKVVELPARRAGLFTVTAISFDPGAARARVQFANGDEVTARLASALAPSVVETAIARGEAILAEEDREGVILLGALRTSATPGIERGEEFVIEAQRLRIVGSQDVVIRSGATQLVLRAAGMIETIARDITTRAAGVHKLVGRMLHLN